MVHDRFHLMQISRGGDEVRKAAIPQTVPDLTIASARLSPPDPPFTILKRAPPIPPGDSPTHP